MGVTHKYDSDVEWFGSSDSDDTGLGTGCLSIYFGCVVVFILVIIAGSLT